MANGTGSAHERVVTELARLLKRAAPLAELVESDEYSPAEPSRLRDLTGPDTVFGLSNHLNRLCSERARAKFRGRPYPPPETKSHA